MQKKPGNNTNLIEAITNDQALIILKNLWGKNKELKKHIEDEINNLLENTDCDEVCEELLFDLENLSVEDLFDRSGPGRNGYHDPWDVAYTMMEETVNPFQEQMNRYFMLRKNKQAVEYCKGIIKALYNFKKESNTDFLEQAADNVGELAGNFFNETAKNLIKEDIQNLQKFLSEECPDWHFK